jgi:hypothetical protein
MGWLAKEIDPVKIKGKAMVVITRKRAGFLSFLLKTEPKNIPLPPILLLYLQLN